MFNLRHEDIDFEKIKAFYDQKVPESETIEYKQLMPENEKLAKTISAMSNTYGGILFIGIEADKDNNIPIAIRGIDPQKGLQEKITSICLSSIYPPVFPETKMCDFSDENGVKRVILFIRMYESDRTPHAINNNTDVYIRVKSQSEKFEKKATQDEIDWLKDRREKAVKFREDLLNRARERYQSKTNSHQGVQNWYKEIYVIPLFPHNMLFSYEDFFNILKKARNEVQEEGFKDYIEILAKESKSAADSLYMLDMRPGGAEYQRFISYQELNVFGLIYRKESFEESCVPETEHSFDMKLFLSLLYYVLRFGILLYKCVGYEGIIKVGIEIKGLLGREIEWISGQRPHRPWIKNEFDNFFRFEENLLRIVLEDKLEDFILQIYKKFLWSVGVRYSDDMINRMIGEINIVKSSFKN